MDAAFMAIGVMQLTAKELHASAHAEHMAAPSCIQLQSAGKTVLFEGLQIPQRLLAAWHDHRIGLAELFSGCHPAQLNRWFGFQGVKVGEVAQRWQLQHRDLQLGAALAATAFQQIKGILRWK